MLPDYYVLTQLPATPGSQGQHRVLRAPEESSVAFPFLLVEHAILVQIHSIKSFEHLPVVDLIPGEFAVMIVVPLGQSGGPGVELEASPRIAAR